MKNREIVKIIEAWIYSMPNPRTTHALNNLIAASHEPGILIQAEEHPLLRHSHRGYMWFDLRTSVDLGLIPKELNDKKKITELKKFVKENLRKKEVVIKSNSVKFRKNQVKPKESKLLRNKKVEKFKNKLNRMDTKKRTTYFQKNKIKSEKDFQKHIEKKAA